MEKDSFLDTNVIFNYSNYIQEQLNEIVRKCYFYIVNKKTKFIVCGAVLEELSEIVKKRARIHKAVVNKLKDEDFSFDKLLSNRDIPFAKKVYENFKNQELKKVASQLATERDLSVTSIQKFLKVKVDEKVIPVEQIETELVNKIHDVIPNHADCKIIASAIQLQESREIFLFVTADARDLDPNGYDYLKKHFKVNFPKEKYIFPELLNLVFTK